MQQTIKRKLTAILSADVSGYSRLMDDDEISTVRTLQAYRKIISDLTSQHNGRVIDNPGDNLLAEFVSVVDAVQCAVEIQHVLKSKNNELPDNRKMVFRIGINLGDVIEDDDRIYGDGVNIAARVESLADPGGICISGTVYDHVMNKLDLRYEDLGEHQVKNIRRPVRVYKILVEIEPEESILDSIIDMSVPTDKPSIAVLPFVNMSDDPSQEYFSDGMTEAIITALAKVPDILVIASTSTFMYKGQKVKVQQVGKDLGVKYLLEGSVQKAGNRIRLTAQLIDAATGNHWWAERYDRELKEIFDLQDELTTRILEELSIKLWHDVSANLTVKGTNNLRAYLRWWKGIGHYMRFKKNDNALARKNFEEVVQLDPSWGEGYAFLGWANVTDYIFGWCSSPKKCIQEAVECARKAIALEDTSPQPYGVLSLVNLFTGHYDEAIAEAEKAIAQHPDFFAGYHALGIALFYLGSPNKAREMFKKSIQLSHIFSNTKAFIGMTYFDSGEYIESIVILKNALRELPDFIHTHVYLIASYILIEMKEEAFKQAEEILRIDPSFSVDAFSHQIPYKNQSDTDRILDALRKAALK